MSKIGRIGAVLAATVAAAGMGALAAASPAAAAPAGPRPVTNWLKAIPSNDSTWVPIYWKTGSPVCHAKVWVDGGRRIDVSYANHRSYASFFRNDTLRPGQVDYTAVDVDPNFSRPGVAVLRATISYDTCGWHARTKHSTYLLNLPITRGHGNDGHGDGHGGWHGGGNGGGNGGHDGGNNGGTGGGNNGGHDGGTGGGHDGGTGGTGGTGGGHDGGTGGGHDGGTGHGGSTI
jgi:hypothetical protein